MNTLQPTAPPRPTPAPTALGASAILALRIALAWWVALVAVAAVASGPLAMVGALVVFPPIALAVGGVAAWTQHRALAGTGTHPLASGARLSLAVALPATQALRLAASAIEPVFGRVPQRLTEDALSARVIESGVAPTGLAALRSDRLSVGVTADGDGRSTLRLACEPAHPWLYGLFWVDAGRCARHVDALARAILARLRQQGEVADTLARQDALQARLAQAELLLLRAQVEPHFLFNTLAHVRAALATEPATAAAMLDALIGFLRANARTAASAEVALADELQRVDGYLSLMRMRLGDRLRYTIDDDAALRAQPVPVACVLILAENAVKHGIERSPTPGTIAVTCRRVDDALVIEVNNDGPGLARDGGRAGGGLDNLRERLRLAHGDAARMIIEDRDEGGVRAVLRMPLRGPHDDGLA